MTEYTWWERGTERGYLRQRGSGNLHRAEEGRGRRPLPVGPRPHTRSGRGGALREEKPPCVCLGLQPERGVAASGVKGPFGDNGNVLTSNHHEATKLCKFTKIVLNHSLKTCILWNINL